MREQQVRALLAFPDTCKLSYTGPTGIEWVCVAKVHATENDLHRSYQKNRRGQYPKHMRHFFVRKPKDE